MDLLKQQDLKIIGGLGSLVPVTYRKLMSTDSASRVIW
jgi:hypothetical protein